MITFDYSQLLFHDFEFQKSIHTELGFYFHKWGNPNIPYPFVIRVLQYACGPTKKTMMT